MIPKVGCDKEWHVSSWRVTEESRWKQSGMSSTDQYMMGDFVGIPRRSGELGPGMWGTAKGSRRCCLALVDAVG